MTTHMGLSAVPSSLAFTSVTRALDAGAYLTGCQRHGMHTCVVGLRRLLCMSTPHKLHACMGASCASCCIICCSSCCDGLHACQSTMAQRATQSTGCMVHRRQQCVVVHRRWRQRLDARTPVWASPSRQPHGASKVLACLALLAPMKHEAEVCALSLTHARACTCMHACMHTCRTK